MSKIGRKLSKLWPFHVGPAQSPPDAGKGYHSNLANNTIQPSTTPAHTTRHHRLAFPGFYTIDA
eukprot:scaffold1461_cov39-Cyclotella_meneghiniana.AAC.1